MNEHTRRFVKETVLDAPREVVFAFHERPEAFSLLLPPWEQTRVLQPPSSLEVGTVVVIETKVGPLWTRIEAEHVAYVPHERFEDVMRKGPFAHWHHTHLFLARGDRCLLRDEITYQLPFGALGRVFAGRFVQRKLMRLFEFRHEVTAREVAKLRARRSSAG
jgi:ligand-binding SRPBCC domain-containing protein